MIALSFYCVWVCMSCVGVSVCGSLTNAQLLPPAFAEQQCGCHVCGLLRVGPGHACCADDHGVPVGLLARSASALGGIPEQILQVRRVLFW